MFGKKNFLFITLTVILSFNFQASANDDDKLVDEAIKSTQEMLRSSSKRQEIFKNDAKSKANDDHISALTGGDAGDSQAIYNISADLLPVIMKMANNDPTKAAALLEKAQKDPQAFYSNLPSEFKNKIRDISGKIEQKSGSGKKP